ncbi:MAG: phenylalanine--tRNA ligase subunit alpha, partial [Firmicutes bacterium]|nr:phenylalanine--tRNA ligase subunit alpha [Bacillota bacterium]
MLSSLENLEEKIKLDIMQAEDDKELKAIRIKYLGKKGKITNILRGLNELPPEKRPQAGKIANELKKFAEQLLHDKEKKFSDKKQQMLLAQEAIDVTLPGSPVSLGHKHPLTIILEEIEDIFTSLGFSVVEGPEVETDYYNFEALNLPKDHPARDMQDSFYITNDILLRTQTSPVQVHTME